MRHGHLQLHVQAAAAPHHAADGHLDLEASRLQKAQLGLDAAARVLFPQADESATARRVDVRVRPVTVPAAAEARILRVEEQGMKGEDPVKE